MKDPSRLAGTSDRTLAVPIAGIGRRRTGSDGAVFASSAPVSANNGIPPEIQVTET